MNKLYKFFVLSALIILGACSCGQKSNKLVCTQHIDVLGFIADEKVTVDIGSGTLNSVSISRNYDLATMIELGSTKEEISTWAEGYKNTADTACESYTSCKADVDYQEGEYLKVNMTISGKDFMREAALDVSGKTSDEIYDVLKGVFEGAAYTCK